MSLARTRGFSLIEAVVAIAVIGTMIASTSLLLQRIPVSGREVRDQDLALKIVRNEIEILRAAGYAELPISGPFTNSLLSSLASSSASVAVSEVNEQMKQVTVSVSWRGDSLTERSVSLSTLMTENSGL